MVINGYNGLRKNWMRSRLAAPHTCGVRTRQLRLTFCRKPFSRQTKAELLNGFNGFLNMV